MRKEDLEELMGCVNGKSCIGKQRLVYLDNWSKWMTETVDETETWQVATLKIQRTTKTDCCRGP